jgi:hypothetical protein
MTNHFERGEHLESATILEEIDVLLAEIDALLIDGRFQSEEEKELYLGKLYGLYAASNNDKVRDMIHYIETEYAD